MLCSTVNSTHNTRPLPPKRNGNRQGRSILTAVECRKAIAGLLLLGSCDRSVPRSCSWQTRQCIGCYPLAFPVPIEKPADFEMDGGEDFQNSLCLWAAALKQIRLLKGWRSRRGFCKVGTTCKPRQRLPQMPHTPSESPRYFAAAG